MQYFSVRLHYLYTAAAVAAVAMCNEEDAGKEEKALSVSAVALPNHILVFCQLFISILTG